MTSPQTAAPFELTTRIERLFIYPIKSCAGIELQEAVLLDTGLDLDRAWMVVDASGDFVSQRELPRMALIQPQLKGDNMILRAPGMLALHIRIDAVEQPATVTVWDDTVPAFDMGDMAAQWFTDFLSLTPAGLPAPNAKKYRLTRFDPDYKRPSSSKWTQGLPAQTQFADGFALLVASQASLDLLNTKLTAAGHSAVTMARFRPNIVLSGGDAHDEDRVTDWHVLPDPADGLAGVANDSATESAAAPVVLRPVKPCARCPIPNVNPATATSSPEVGDMLQTYRQDARVGGGITFGMNAIIVSGADATLRVGQRVGANFGFGL